MEERDRAREWNSGKKEDRVAINVWKAEKSINFERVSLLTHGPHLGGKPHEH